MDLQDGCLQIFDVDHGQCALLTMPIPGGVQRVLIDCGHSVDFEGAPWYPGGHLESMGVSYVDMLVCTNYDEDHASGFADLARRGITVGCILGNPTVAPETIVHLKTEDGMGNGIKLAIMIAIGFLLIEVGLTGRLGSILGAALVPDYMEQQGPQGSTTGGPPSSSGSGGCDCPPSYYQVGDACVGILVPGLFPVIKGGYPCL